MLLEDTEKKEDEDDFSLKIKLSLTPIIHQNKQWNTFLRYKQVNISPCVHNWAKPDGDQGREVLLLIQCNTCTWTHGLTPLPNASQPCVCDLSAPSERHHVDSPIAEKICEYKFKILRVIIRIGVSTCLSNIYVLPNKSQFINWKFTSWTFQHQYIQIFHW